MTSSENAKKGFRTFVLTLSVSLILFSIVYYFLTNDESSESGNDLLSDSSSVNVKEEKFSEADEPEVISPFGQLAVKQEEHSTFREVPVVLAGSTTATTTPTGAGTTTTTPQTSPSVPNGGSMGVTAGLVLSALIFAGAIIWNKFNPRKLALAGFEKKVLQDYDSGVRYTRKYTRYY